jgi:pimeloyl-ACP methyl ester carboxylesterase
VTKFSRVFVISWVVLAAGCSALPTSRVSPPTIKQATVNGVDLKYLEQGEGTTVVFVHGAFSDHRVWEAQREAVAQSYRYIALDQRYFGNARWPDTGSKYSLATHTSDLAAFIRQLNVGPVHVVGWSLGGTIALALAVQHPELVRTLFLNEPALVSIVTDPADVKTLDEERKGVGPAVAASKAKTNWGPFGSLRIG